MGCGVAVLAVVAVGAGVGRMGVDGCVDTAVSVGGVVAILVSVGSNGRSLVGGIVEVGAIVGAC